MSTTTTEELAKLNEQQVKDLNTAFDSFDKRGEGQLKVGDLQACMKKMGHTIKSEWMEKMEDQIDQDGKGYIEKDEFTMLVRKKIQSDIDEQELRDIFRVLDKEKKGEVNTNELRWILKSLGDDLTEEDIDDMIADVDTDGSGWVDYEEFAKLMME